MSEMVDRAALALFDADYPPNVGIAVRWDGTEDWKKNQYRSRVRAVIAAMRVPTEVMAHSGALIMAGGSRRVYMTMIDAALSE